VLILFIVMGSITGSVLGLRCRDDNKTTDSVNIMGSPDDRIRLRDRIPNYRVILTNQEQEIEDAWLVTFTSVATPTSDVEDMVLQSSPNTSLPLRSGNIESFDRLLDSVFGIYSSKAFSIADCEQGYKLSAGIDPYELNRTAIGRAGEVSLWQIHPVHFIENGGPYDKTKLQSDIEYAARSAWELSGFGANWISPWRYCGWQ